MAQSKTSKWLPLARVQPVDQRAHHEGAHHAENALGAVLLQGERNRKSAESDRERAQDHNPREPYGSAVAVRLLQRDVAVGRSGAVAHPGGKLQHEGEAVEEHGCGDEVREVDVDKEEEQAAEERGADVRSQEARVEPREEARHGLAGQLRQANDLPDRGAEEGVELAEGGQHAQKCNEARQHRSADQGTYVHKLPVPPGRDVGLHAEPDEHGQDVRGRDDRDGYGQ
mmetsp:Transcript_60870/g.162955  ORF Transcript_60870/g.162955 Transcript_60870/m.162955 type:complete len:227 (-) Transcript_60870:860-1540(-)